MCGMTDVHPSGQQLSGVTLGSTDTVFVSPTKKFTGKNVAGMAVVIETMRSVTRKFKIEGPPRGW